MQKTGSKAQVWHGNADHTTGGLHKGDLMKNKSGRIVSKKKHALAKVAFVRNKLVPKTKEQLEAIRPL